jgi:hypothetical protein
MSETKRKSPEDRYLNDNEFHMLVDLMESFIVKAQFTPSEMREAAVLASIKYEMRRQFTIPLEPELDGAFKTFERWLQRRLP